MPRAVALGVRAQLAVRLTVDDRPWGAISVCSTEAERIDPEVERLTTLLATHAVRGRGAGPPRGQPAGRPADPQADRPGASAW